MPSLLLLPIVIGSLKRSGNFEKGTNQGTYGGLALPNFRPNPDDTRSSSLPCILGHEFQCDDLGDVR